MNTYIHDLYVYQSRNIYYQSRAIESTLSIIKRNAMFEKPNYKVDYHVAEWFEDTHAQLMPVIKRWMEKKNV